MATVGRYAIFDEIASGGMASVHLARLAGSVGFSRTVAVKRLRRLVDDPEAAVMLVDEARLAARIRHPNVVSTLDVVDDAGNVLIVMDYVHGASFSRLLREDKVRTGVPLDPAISCAVVVSVLHGLHAAHEAVSDRGEPLVIVHRDVSPQNVLVGVDGVARLLDFGIAKARQRLRTTRDGRVRGKLAYMPPEQLEGSVSRRTDVYAAGVVLWEALTGSRLFAGKDEAETMSKVLHAPVERPSALSPRVDAALDAIVMRSLERDPEARWATAREMAVAIEDAVALAPASRIGAWVEATAAEELARRSELVRAIEAGEARASEPPSDAARPSREPTVAERPAGDDPSIVVMTRSSRQSATSPKRAVVGAVVVIGAAAVATLLIGRHASSNAAAVPRIAASSVAPLPASAAPLPPPPATAQPRELASAPAHVAGPAHRTAEPSTPAAKPADPSCDPPYRIGKDGLKTWLPGCL